MENLPPGSQRYLGGVSEEHGGNGREAVFEAAIAGDLPELKKYMSLEGNDLLRAISHIWEGKKGPL